MKIVVSGMFAKVPGQGGLVWVMLQYVLGLRLLGHDVLLIEPVDDSDLCPEGVPLAGSANAASFENVVRRFGLVGSAALLHSGRRETVGVTYAAARRHARDSDLLINVAGGLTDPDLVGSIPRRVYLDLDPGFTQLWQAVEGIDMRFAGHTHFATVGLGIGGDDCPVPTCGLDWIPTCQPVVLARWPIAGRVERNALTTVANWRGYGSIEAGGVFYGQKAHSVRRLIDLPRRTGARFELALAIDPGEPEDLAALALHGWELVDPRVVASSAFGYHRFVQGSWAEFGVAKSGYVESRSGWFSDRSVCYLASGRPVLAQDTGFGDVLPTGEGLFAFSDGDGVGAALETLRRDYDRQRRAARRIAEEHFASHVVLPRLLEAVA